MKTIKRWLCATLAIILALTLCACGATPANSGGELTSPDGKEGTKGMFVQSILDSIADPTANPDLWAMNLEQWADGTLALLGTDLETLPHLFTSSDTQSWQNTTSPESADLIKRIRAAGFSALFSMTQDGSWWVAANDYSSIIGSMSSMDTAEAAVDPAELPELGLYRFIDGEEQAFSLRIIDAAKANGETMVVQRILSGPGQTICFSLSNLTSGKTHCIIYDCATNEEIGELVLNSQENDIYTSFIKGNEIYINNTALDQIVAYSLPDGIETKRMDLPNLDAESVSFAIADNGDVCYADAAGIHRIAWGGSLVQDVVTGTQYVFSASQFSPGGLVVLPDDSYLLLALDNSGSKLCHFVFDENAQIDAANSLSIWAMEETHILRAAISAFSTQNSGTYVTVEYGRTADNAGVTDEDIIRTLNTRLVAGDVPDVLILDGLPTSTYMKQGILTDLNGKVDISGCYENIMQAFTRENKAYAYPTLFQMPVFVATAGEAKTDGISSLSELADLAKEDEGLYYCSYLEMFESLYAAYSNKIFPDAASLDEAALVEFLHTTSEISNALSLTDQNDYRHGGMGASGVYPRQGISALSERCARYAADILLDPIDACILFLFADRTVSPLPGECYIPICAAGIPVGAKQEAAALQFINTMLTDVNVQDARMDQGFSVRIGQHADQYAKGNESYVGNPLSVDWDALATQFTSPAIMEKLLQTKLYEQAEKLYRGEMTAEETANAVAAATKLYFAERQ